MSRYFSKTPVELRASIVAKRTEDAYSFDTYGAKEWYRVAVELMTRGFDDLEVEAVLRSKWMRSAADRVSGGSPWSNHAIDYIWSGPNGKKLTDKWVAVGVARLVLESFSHDDRHTY